MDNSSTTNAWTVAAIVLVVVVIGLALWYGITSTSTTPGTPNTGAAQTTATMPAATPSGSTSY